MRTLLHILVLMVGGLLVITGCSSTNVASPTQIDSQVSPTNVPTQMPQSDEVEAQTSSGNFVFYDSFASW